MGELQRGAPGLVSLSIAHVVPIASGIPPTCGTLSSRTSPRCKLWVLGVSSSATVPRDRCWETMLMGDAPQRASICPPRASPRASGRPAPFPAAAVAFSSAHDLHRAASSRCQEQGPGCCEEPGSSSVHPHSASMDPTPPWVPMWESTRTPYFQAHQPR